MDFDGPVLSNYYFFLLIDEHSRFSKVQILKSTATETLLLKLHKILCTHVIPEVIKSDHAPPPPPPLNEEKIKEYARRKGFNHHRIEPGHPESNGLAENFMRILTIVAHTAHVESQDPIKEVNNFLLNYRAIPHSVLKVHVQNFFFGGGVVASLVPSLQATLPPSPQIFSVISDTSCHTPLPVFQKY